MERRNVLRLVIAQLLAAVSVLGADLRIPAWVQQSGAPPATAVQAEELRAAINDVEAPVTASYGPSDPLILLVVLDMVGDLNRIDAARGALASYIQAMGGQTYVALLQAQDGLRTLEDPSQDRARLVERLMASSVSGFPGLLDSIEQVSAIGDSMLARAGVRVAALYLTDGSISAYRGDYVNTVVNPSDSGDLSRRFGDRLIQEKIAALNRSLLEYALPLFVVHLEERNGSQDIAYQNGIMQFAVASGGAAWFSRSVADVPQLVGRALEKIDSHYSLAISAPEGLTGATQLRLSVERTGVAVEHRSQLSIRSPSSDKKSKKSASKRKRGES